MSSLFREEALVRPQRSLYQAQSFLNAIEPGKKDWQFVAIRENRNAPKSWPAFDEYQGHLDEIGYQLERDNRHSGIFVRLNDEDRIRVIWKTEKDGHLSSFSKRLPPSAVVATGIGEWFAYWFVDRGLSREDFSQIMGPTSLDTIFRLPGFFSFTANERFLAKTMYQR